MDDERTTKMTDMDIKDVLQSLAKQGFVKITLEYSGGSDDGYFEAPMFFVEDKKTKKQKSKIPDWRSIDEKLDEDEFIHLIYQDMGRLNQWYSFAGDYSCNGTLTIDPITGEFEDSGQQSIYEPALYTGNVFKDKKYESGI